MAFGGVPKMSKLRVKTLTSLTDIEFIVFFFFDIKKRVHYEFVPSEITVNVKFYLKVVK